MCECATLNAINNSQYYHVYGLEESSPNGRFIITLAKLYHIVSMNKKHISMDLRIVPQFVAAF